MSNDGLQLRRAISIRAEQNYLRTMLSRRQLQGFVMLRPENIIAVWVDRSAKRSDPGKRASCGHSKLRKSHRCEQAK